MSASRKAKPEHTHVIPRGTQGTLTGSAEKKWSVRVADEDDDRIMLVLMFDTDDLDAEHGVLTLECITDQGVTRFRGDVALEDRDLIRFHVVGEPELVQRREFVRVSAPQRVLVVGSDDTSTGSGYSLDISGGGMLLKGLETLNVGDAIRFHLHLDPDAPPIQGRGRVVRSAPGGKRGICFERISTEDRERLIHFIFARQREARARTRAD